MKDKLPIIPVVETPMSGMDPKDHGHQTWADLFKEMQQDEAAGKREDAHWYGKEAFQKILAGKTDALEPEPAKGKEQDKQIDR